MARGLLTQSLALSLALAAIPVAAKAPETWVVDSVVVVMRHGVRPPTKDPAMPAGIAAQGWPAWDVPPGWLTAHGAAGVEQLGALDAAWLRHRGALPRAGCPAAPAIRIIADSDQRTIATAQSWAKGALGPCPVMLDHRPQGQDDPRFTPLSAGLSRLDPVAVDGALTKAQGAGGLAALDAAMMPLIARLNRILCGDQASGCGIPAEPSTIRAATPTQRPKLSGMLDRASTAAQILLLEYANGKPMADVGWGRASAQDIAALSRFHAEEFRLLARPAAIAVPNLAGLRDDLTLGLAGHAKLTVIVGHDTNIANLAGALGLHWHVPGYAPDDPAPGGAIILETGHTRAGKRMVKAYYRAQSLDDLRVLNRAPAGTTQAMPFDACAGQRARQCPLAGVIAMLGGAG